jgi:hypothetical protein
MTALELKEWSLYLMLYSEMNVPASEWFQEKREVSGRRFLNI